MWQIPFCIVSKIQFSKADPYKKIATIYFSCFHSNLKVINNWNDLRAKSSFPPKTILGQKFLWFFWGENWRHEKHILKLLTFCCWIECSSFNDTSQWFTLGLGLIRLPLRSTITWVMISYLLHERRRYFFCYTLRLFEFLEASDHTIVQEFRIILVKLLSVSLVLKSVSKKRLQHSHSHCDCSMNIWENYSSW